jgi:hypothetical protein
MLRKLKAGCGLESPAEANGGLPAMVTGSSTLPAGVSANSSRRVLTCRRFHLKSPFMKPSDLYLQLFESGYQNILVITRSSVPTHTHTYTHKVLVRKEF